MIFKGIRGLVIDGVEFEEEFLETEDKELISKLIEHPVFGRFFFVVSSKTEEDSKSGKSSSGAGKSSSKPNDMKLREERGIELNSKTAKELNVIAKGLGYGGEQLSKIDLILWIIKAEEELAKGVEEGKDEGKSNS